MTVGITREKIGKFADFLTLLICLTTGNLLVYRSPEKNSKFEQMGTANEILIENLENQLGRLVEQLNDLEECRSEISAEEFELMKEETVEQIKEFSETLDRMQRGDTSLECKVSVMKKAIRQAVSMAFNTEDTIKFFGPQNSFEIQLQQLEEDFRLKKVDSELYKRMKLDILLQLRKQARKLSPEEAKFVQEMRESEMDNLEKVED